MSVVNGHRGVKHYATLAVDIVILTVSSVRLRANVHVIFAVLREALEECLDHGVVVSCSLSVASHVIVLVVRIAETHTAWCLNENHVGDFVPSILVERQSHVLVRAERTLLGKEAQKS
jgi:hypothetical protein